MVSEYILYCVDSFKVIDSCFIAQYVVYLGEEP